MANATNRTNGPTPHPPSPPADQGKAAGVAGDKSGGDARGIILKCLARIRRRLWLVRLMERLALAISWGAGSAMLLAGARLLRDRYTVWATLPAAAVVAASAWLFMRSRKARMDAAIGRGVMQGGAVLGAVMGLAGIAMIWMAWGRVVTPWEIVAAVLGLFAAVAVSSVRAVPISTAAIFVDQRAGLEERVSTALEMLETAPASPLEAAFREPLIESAVAACYQVKRSKVGYRRLDERAYAIAATAALAAAGVSLLTPLPSLARPQQKKYVQVVDTARRLEDVLKEVEKKTPINDKVTLEKVKPLESALAELKKGNVGPVDASALLESAKEQMKRDSEQMEASEKVQDMLKSMEQTRDLASATDPLKDARMQEAAGDANAGQRQQAAKSDLEKAAQGLGNKVSNGMSEDEKKKLAEGLRDAAAQAGKSGDTQLQRDLTNAASAAEKGDGQKLAGDMAAAGARMGQQRADHAMSQEAVKQAMSEIDRMQQNGMSAGEQQASGEQGNQGGGQQGNQAGGQQGSQSAGASGGQNGGQQGQNGEEDGQGRGGQQGSAGAQQQSDGGGAGQQSGQGEKQGQGQGSGAAQTGGSGSTNFSQPGGPGDKKEGGPIGKEGTFVRIYEEKDVKTAGAQEKVGGQINPLGGPAAGTMEVLGQAEKGESTIQSYRDAMPAARQRVMDDLNKQDIPAQYQDMVKSFYEK